MPRVWFQVIQKDKRINHCEYNFNNWKAATTSLRSRKQRLKDDQDFQLITKFKYTACKKEHKWPVLWSIYIQV